MALSLQVNKLYYVGARHVANALLRPEVYFAIFNSMQLPTDY